MYRLNQVPDLNYIKFLQLIGIELAPAQPARADVTLRELHGGRAGAGVELESGRVDGRALAERRQRERRVDRRRGRQHRVGDQRAREVPDRRDPGLVGGRACPTA